MPRIDDAPGITTFRTVPSGAMTEIGRKMPAVLGRSWRNAARTHRAATEKVKEKVLLIAPGACSAVPVKSAVRLSPSTVRATCSFTGGPPIPSESM